jgi:hypothetical protein
MTEVTMKTMLIGCCILGALLLSLSTGGCSQSVTVTASDSICKKSVEVHLVGVNRFEKDLWDTTSMTDYWTPGNQLRKSAEEYTYVIQFGRGPCEIVLDKKSPVLKAWKTRKAEYMFVLADLPGVFTDSAGNADPRRLRLPAPGSKRWGLQKKIDIKIEESNIVSLTVPKSE